MADAQPGEGARADRGERRSPPARRVIRILDHFVQHPDRRYGLSDLARRLEISKPTCLGILTELCASGYLVRDDADTTYGLGPSLIAAGRAASTGLPMGVVARRHLELLAAEFRSACTASAVAGGRIVVLESVGPLPEGGRSATGKTYPFAPPVGLMYALWEPDEVFEQWLSREPTAPVRLDRDRLRSVVAQCRARGYLVDRLTPAGQRLYRLMAGFDTADLPEEVRGLVGEMVTSLGERVYLPDADDVDVAADGRHRVNVIAAPVFDAAGRQAMVVTLHVGDEISRDEIERRAAALRGTAAAVTAELHGSDPFA
ncbi:IclR family transcriptional regulator [Tomitella fengzijianii]|uniref:Helix-turn-helix domain-containing protein n=1 Tax=Tomitella fengzijianii TaxID=2597660 RepID=A0A516X204_9ACTN|nr:helix-turn-helix domain-containing protein [Tomitella fengzijianii]QDQ97047.1 helix-turn-helix domain-containing protein [Tomitella fengzijianii]